MGLAAIIVSLGDSDCFTSPGTADLRTLVSRTSRTPELRGTQAIGPDLLPRPIDQALIDLKRLHLRLGSSRRLLPDRVGHRSTLVCPAPWLQPHYRAFLATTSRPAPVPRIGTLPLAVSAARGSPFRDQAPLPWPTASRRQVLLFHASARDEFTPPLHRTPPRQHAVGFLAESLPNGHAFVPGVPTAPGFDVSILRFRCVSSGSRTFVFPSPTSPRSRRDFSVSLTTPALNRRRIRRFGTPDCSTTPEDLPPSLAQHGSCQRPSTSPSLPFQDTRRNP